LLRRVTLALQLGYNRSPPFFNNMAKGFVFYE
jgi:hypothetical protein